MVRSTFGARRIEHNRRAKRPNNEMTGIRTILTCVLVTWAAGCTQPRKAENSRPPEVAAVQIISMPPNGGYAQCRFSKDGKIDGGHSSGGRVHTQTGNLTAAQLKAMWSAVASLDHKAFTHGSTIDSSSRGKMTLVLHCSGGLPAAKLSWKFAEQPEESTIKALVDLMMKHRIGGW